MESVELNVRNALISLSETIKNLPEESSLSRSEECLAFLHAQEFHRTAGDVIAAIEFVDRVYEQTCIDVTGISDEKYSKFVPTIQAISVALAALYLFVDDMKNG
jgi:hypothetical protein